MRHLFEEGTRKEERKGGEGTFSVWLFLSYGPIFIFFLLSYFCFSLVP